MFGILGQAARRDRGIAGRQGGLQRGERQAVARQLVGIDLDFDLLLLAADDGYLRDARDLL